MPKKSMKEIRALAKKKVSGEERNTKRYNPDVYPFWKMNEGEVATVRFLPDKNTDNDFPLVERLDNWLTIDGKKRRITSPKTFDPKARCPIAELSAKYYDAGDEENGKYYYRSATHLARALVISDHLPPDPETGETYKGKVVTLQLGYQLYTKFMEDLGNVFDDDDALPWDLEEGFNFNLKKITNKGGQAKWDSSSYFDRKPSPIPDEYLENIELIDLRELLGEPTTYDEVNELLAQHLNGSVDKDGDDDLDKKRVGTQNSEKSSKRAAALARLKGEDVSEGEGFDDVPDFDDSTGSSDDGDDRTEAADDDDGDDLSDLQNLIRNRRKSA